MSLTTLTGQKEPVVIVVGGVVACGAIARGAREPPEGWEWGISSPGSEYVAWRGVCGNVLSRVLQTSTP